MKKYIFILGIIASSFISIIGFSQNISINTTGAANSSSSMLEVLQPAGAATGTIGLYINHPGTTGTIYGLQSIVNGASTTHYAGYFSATNATNNYALVVPSGGGYAGIGTITPASPLEVDGVVNNWAAKFVGPNTANESFGPLIVAGTSSSDAALSVYNASVGTNYLYVRGDGNIGIGTTGPAQKLDIYGNVAMNGRLALSDLGDGWLRLNQSSNYGNGTYTPGFLRCD